MDFSKAKNCIHSMGLSNLLALEKFYSFSYLLDYTVNHMITYTYHVLFHGNFKAADVLRIEPLYQMHFYGVQLPVFATNHLGFVFINAQSSQNMA